MLGILQGASVIQMLRGLSGKAPFQVALQQYLKKYEYGNARSSDLWDIIERVSMFPYCQPRNTVPFPEAV